MASDGGVMLLAAAARRMRIVEHLAAVIPDPRSSLAGVGAFEPVALRIEAEGEFLSFQLIQNPRILQYKANVCTS